MTPDIRAPKSEREERRLVQVRALRAHLRMIVGNDLGITYWCCVPEAVDGGSLKTAGGLNKMSPKMRPEMGAQSLAVDDTRCNTRARVLCEKCCTECRSILADRRI